MKEKKYDNWLLSEIEPNEVENYLNNYWEKRGYKEKHLLEKHVKNIQALYEWKI